MCVNSHPLLLKSRPAKNQIMYFMYFRTPSREPQKVCTVYTFFSLCIIQILRRPPQRVMMEHKINPARLPMMSDKGPVKLSENSNKKSQIPNSPRKTSIDHDEFAERSPQPHYRSLGLLGYTRGILPNCCQGTHDNHAQNRPSVHGSLHEIFLRMCGMKVMRIVFHKVGCSQHVLILRPMHWLAHMTGTVRIQ